jgi:Tol biopolymer transport system component
MSENNFIARPALAVYNNGGGDLPSLPYYIAVGAYQDDDNGTDSGSVYLYDLDGTNEVKITASDGASNDLFGYSVAVGDNKIAVGAYEDDDNGSRSGSIYVYDLDGTNEVKITASDGAGGDYFGGSVAIGNNKIAVGAYGDNITRGSVYVYDLDGTNEVKITASDVYFYDRFGWSVAVGNNKIVVGTRLDDDNGTDSGSVYVYDLDGTNEVKITASDGAANDYFGHSVAVGNNKIAVGAYRDDGYSGSVYVYDLDGTNEVKITASDGAAYDEFGYSVAVGDNKIVVGAVGDNDNGSTSGSVYVYDLDGTNEVKITASDGASGDNFGWSVAVGDNKIVVGAYGDDGDWIASGSVYVYDLDGTNEVKITASDGASNDLFGWSVAVGN